MLNYHRVNFLVSCVRLWSEWTNNRQMEKNEDWRNLKKINATRSKSHESPRVSLFWSSDRPFARDSLPSLGAEIHRFWYYHPQKSNYPQGSPIEDAHHFRTMEFPQIPLDQPFEKRRWSIIRQRCWCSLRFLSVEMRLSHWKMEIEPPTRWDWTTNRNGAWTKVWYLTHQNRSYLYKCSNHGDPSNIKCGIEPRKPWEKLQFCKKQKT